MRSGCSVDEDLAAFKSRYFGAYIDERLLSVFKGLLADCGMQASEWVASAMLRDVEAAGLSMPDGDVRDEDGLNYVEEPYFENAKPIVGDAETVSNKHEEAYELLQDFLIDNDGALCRETILECCAEHSVASATALRALAAGVKNGVFDRYQKGRRVYYYIGPLEMNPDGSPPVGIRPPKPTRK